ncbi:MAG TPA: DUF1002 domain-containing protein [Clostridia bacterium]|mgnify:CR=1 FL=1|nr:DUF1002 domain-containing protein [Clostridia bacterium]HPK14905.1 DUF1002 domain-containing protein [Clostridia bacterium]
MKRLLAALLCAALVIGGYAGTALAYEEGDARVTIGADLTAEQKAQIYADFGIAQGDVPEIVVTNENERKYLEGLAPEGKIGKVALSCVYITILEQGEGLDISTKNINWCTADMYTNALVTAGITDAKVVISAPFPVSGTAALTGIYKAYEDITGQTLSELAKTVGVEELITTGNLAEYIGSAEAAEIVNELKKILDQTQTMTDDEVRAEIKRIAEQYNVSLSDAQLEQLLKLCRSLEKLDVDELRQKLIDLAKTVEKAGQAAQTISKIEQSVKNFFASVGAFFAKLFGKG